MSDSIMNNTAADLEPSSSVQEGVTSSEVTESTSSSFIDSLPEDLRGEVGLKDFKDVGGLAKSFIDSQRMIGNSIRIPGEDASDEVRNEFYQKLSEVPGVMRSPNMDDADAMGQFYNALGRPESAEGYKLDIGEDISLDAGQVDKFKEFAHKNGFNNKQVNELMKFEVERANAQSEMAEVKRNEAEAVLREKWGHEYSNRVNGAKLALKSYSEKYPEAIADLLGSQAGNNPALVAILSDLAVSLQEQGTIGEVSRVQYGITSEEAKEQINEILHNKSHAYYNEYDVTHDAAVEKVSKLYNVAFPDER